jgi:hypothetical protein
MGDDLDLRKGLPVGVIAVGVVIVPMGVDDVSHRFVGDLANLGDDSPSNRRVDVGIDNENILVVDDYSGVTVDRSGERIVSGVDIDAAAQGLPRVPRVDLLGENDGGEHAQGGDGDDNRANGRDLHRKGLPYKYESTSPRFLSGALDPWLPQLRQASRGGSPCCDSGERPKRVTQPENGQHKATHTCPSGCGRRATRRLAPEPPGWRARSASDRRLP